MLSFFGRGGGGVHSVNVYVNENMKSTPYHHTLQHSPMRRWLEPLEPPLAQLTGHLDAELKTKGLRVSDNWVHKTNIYKPELNSLFLGGFSPTQPPFRMRQSRSGFAQD